MTADATTIRRQGEIISQLRKELDGFRKGQNALFRDAANWRALKELLEISGGARDEWVTTMALLACGDGEDIYEGLFNTHLAKISSDTGIKI